MDIIKTYKLQFFEISQRVIVMGRSLPFLGLGSQLRKFLYMVSNSYMDGKEGCVF